METVKTQEKVWHVEVRQGHEKKSYEFSGEFKTVYDIQKELGRVLHQEPRSILGMAVWLGLE